MTDAIVAACNAAGVHLSQAQAVQLGTHLEMTLAANRRFNLTAVDDPDAAIALHVVDSLLILPEVLGAPAGTLVDLGTGAGFPGIPLAVLTNRVVELVESVGKKARFLREVVRALDLEERVRIHHERAEHTGARAPGEFAVVTARAVTSLPSLVELASPLLQQDGVLVCMKGRVREDELISGVQAASIVGMAPMGKREYRLPMGGEHRTCVVYLKTGNPSISLPRREGRAQRKPLA